MSQWQFAKRIIPLLAVFLLVFTGCSALQEPGPLNPQGAVGQDQLWIIMLSLVIMSIVLVTVFILFFYVLIRYRKRKGQTGIPVQVEGNHKLELTWTIIPLVLLFILAVPTVAMTFEQAEEYNEEMDAVLVKVTGHQFWWEFNYADEGIITAQELVVPADKRIYFELTTSDVNHSFWIPALGGKLDNTAGLTNKFYLDTGEEGMFRGRCAELCGTGHALMNFNVKVVSQSDFDEWVAGMTAPLETVSEDLEQAFQIYSAKCIGCHAIDTQLGGLGPNLAGFANREYVAGYLPNEDEDLRNWISNPDDWKPGTKMPAIPLTDEELDEIVRYLNSLK